MIFSSRNCNYPQPKYAKWWLSQFRRWGMVEGAPDYEGVAKQVMRTDIYEEAMKEIGVTHGGRDDSGDRCSTAWPSIPSEPDEVRQVFRPSKSARGSSHDDESKYRSCTCLPLRGHARSVLVIWALSSATWAANLPSPFKTWEASKLYMLEPFEKRGELDQGILRFTWYSLVRVAKGYALAIVLGMPLRLPARRVQDASPRAFDPIIQILRPVSPLAWLPLGLVLFQKPEPAGTFTIAMCSMWPTVLNTALGVRSIPQDYINVGRVLGLSPMQAVVQDPAARGAALHVHGLSPQPRYRLAGDRGRRDAHRCARRRWLPVAGIQRADLRAHHLCILTIGLVGFVPRPPDEHGRSAHWVA